MERYGKKTAVVENAELSSARTTEIIAALLSTL